MLLKTSQEVVNPPPPQHNLSQAHIIEHNIPEHQLHNIMTSWTSVKLYTSISFLSFPDKSNKALSLQQWLLNKM